MAVSPDDTSAQAGGTSAKAGKAESLLRERASRTHPSSRPTHEENKSAFGVQREPDPQEGTGQKSAHFRESKSRAQAFTDYVKGKFDKENLFGSVFLLALALNTLQGAIVGLNQQKVVEENGTRVIRKDVDKTRIAVAIASATATMWTFLSSRRGDAPEGNNMAQRMWDSITHPNRSQVQARELVILPISAVAVAGHLYYGANMGNRKDYFNGRPASAGEFFGNTKNMLMGTDAPTRLYQAVASISTTALALSSLFGKEAERKKAKEDKEKAQKEAEKQKKTDQGQAETAKEKDPAEKDASFSTSKSKQVGGSMMNPIKVFKVTWEENPKLVVSSALSFLSSVALFVEGVSKQKSMQNRLDKITDFHSDEGKDVMKTMMKKPKYGQLSDSELLHKLPEFKQDQMKESVSLRRMGVIGMTLNLCGQIYRATQLGRTGEQSR